MSPLTPTSPMASSLIAAPAELSRPHLTRPGRPLLATAFRCVCTAARPDSATNVVKGLPVAYPGFDPSSSAAALLTRKTVASLASRNKGTGASVKAALSSRRSLASESVGRAPPAAWPPAVSGASRPIAASSSAKAASSSEPTSAAGRPAA